MLLEESLIEVKEDFYHEEILFDDPDELMKIFADLEERNLNNILKTQEV